MSVFLARRDGMEWCLLTVALLLFGGSNAWLLQQQYRYVEQEEGNRLQVAAHQLADLMGRRLPAEDFRALMASVRYAPDLRVSAQVDGEWFEWGAAGSDGEGWKVAGATAFLPSRHESGQTASLLSGVYDTDGEELLVAVRALPAGSIDATRLVGIARRRAVIHANWCGMATWHLGLFLATLLSSVFALFALQRRQRRLDTLRAERHVEQRAAAERLRLATDLAGLGVWEYDPVSGRLRWDASIYALYGIDPAVSTVTTCEDWSKHVLPEDLPAAEAALHASVRDRHQFRMNFRIRRGDGQIRLIRALAQPLFAVDGSPLSVIGINQDMTDCVEAEREQEELRNRLARAARMEILGAMAASIAHDFNNILVAILGFSGLGRAVVRAAGGSGRVASYFKEIETAGERARELVQQLLVFSRGGTLHVSVVSVADGARAVVDLLASSFPMDVTLSMRIDDDLPTLDIDRSHLSRILVNLCLNARNAMAGPGEVCISAQRVGVDPVEVCASCHAEFAGEFVRIAVSDEGCGIPQAIHDRIFEPFFTTREPGMGAGMGLAVVHGLVHLYQGHVQMQSVAGQGSTLAILLPRSVWHAGAASEGSPAGAATD
ncbi:MULTISPECIES: ATP-binding protein [Candidatus Accumulibacter]|uniref:histidine kinase n=1 Tax=Candidatus Accumulibacter cognatus TaxID=2954383 RepID=A0A080ME44_9PROT|nr:MULTISPECIES: ATP-binding protein [Candidatus Accumulibacter]KFB75494.1 MAG: Wide host range VirA protein [Candidatus Accumulibacter cognatus]MCM8623520.1 ATP-binding protein [Accumulibacter sp.]